MLDQVGNPEDWFSHLGAQRTAVSMEFPNVLSCDIDDKV